MVSLSGGTGLLALSQGAMLGGEIATAADGVYGIVSAAWETSVQDTFLDGALNTLEGMVQGFGTNIDMPGFNLDAGCNLSIPLRRTKGNGLNISMLLAGGIKLAYSDNREWEASAALDVGAGGEWKLPYFELEAAGGWRRAASASPLCCRHAALVGQVNRFIHTTLTKSSRQPSTTCSPSYFEVSPVKCSVAAHGDVSK